MTEIITPNDQSTSLEISEYFASFLRETEQTLDFRIYCSILQSEIVTKNYARISIEVFNDAIVSAPGQQNLQIFSPAQAFINPPNPSGNQGLIDEILNKWKNQTNSTSHAQKSKIATASINLLSAVNPYAVSLLKSGKPPSEIPELFSKTNVLTTSNVFENLSQVNTFPVNPKGLMWDLSTKFQIDPSSVSGHDQDPHGLVTLLKNYYLNDAINNLPKDTQYYTEESMVKLVDRVYLNTEVKIPKGLIEGNITVCFYLLESQNYSPVTKIVKNLDAYYLIRLTRQINDIPKVSFSNNSLSITQAPSKSNSIEVHKKTLNSQGEFTDYVKVADLSLPPNNTASLKIQKKSNEIEFYRFKCYSSSNSVKSPFYRNLAIGELKTIDSTSLIVSSDPQSKNSVLLEIKNVPSWASQIKVTRRLRINDDAFGPQVDVLPYKNIVAGVVNGKDISVQVGNIYEYTVYIKTAEGTIKKSISQIYRYFNSMISSSISSRIEETVISVYSGSPQVSFVITTTSKKRAANKIKQILSGQGIYEEFSDNLLSSKDDFDQVLYHKVTRINLVTGMRETFDDTSFGQESTTVNFIDNVDTQKLFSITPLNPLHNYRYEVRVFSRDPASLTKNSFVTKKTKLDSKFKKYHYRPYKWRQPSTLMNGTIPAVDGITETIINEGSLLDDGELGVTAAYTLPSFSSFLGVRNVQSKRLDINYINLSWETLSDISNYDHFVIIKEVDRKREIVGTVNTPELNYMLKKSDRGTIIFYVIPVLRDFTVGTAARLDQSLIIDPEEMNGYILE